MRTATTERNRPETWRGDHGWRQQAACAGTETDMFFPPHGMRGQARDKWIADAKKVCAQCVVRLECAAYAAEFPERYGIWGGVTEEERGYGSHSERKKGKR